MYPIQLDSTLADLYRKHGIQGPFFTSTYCVFGHMDLHPEFPRETIYPEDEEPVPYSSDEDERARLRKIILGLKPLKRAFVLGDMDVLFFGPCTKAENVDRVISQLPPAQRPQPRYIDLDEGEVNRKLLELSKGRKLVYWRPQGWMLDHDCLIDPNLSYKLSSKEYLITSAIQTPASEMVKLAPEPSGTSALRDRPLPFVVKLCLAGCGFGTHIVTTEDRRKSMIAAMTDCKGRGIGRVMVSEFIDLKQDLSAHLVVGAPNDEKNKQNPLLIGVTVQNLTENGHWTGGSIDYEAQAGLGDLLMDTIRDTTRRLPDAFMGWCGLDIVIDEKGKQWVVDLNPRFTGSMPICLLSDHFSKRRGMRLAEFAVFQYGGECDDIYDILSLEINSGKIVLNSVMSIGAQSNMVDLVWGGRDREDIIRTAGLIRAKLSSHGKRN